MLGEKKSHSTGDNCNYTATAQFLTQAMPPLPSLSVKTVGLTFVLVSYLFIYFVLKTGEETREMKNNSTASTSGSYRPTARA